jgi:hypothetical protein
VETTEVMMEVVTEAVVEAAAEAVVVVTSWFLK